MIDSHAHLDDERLNVDDIVLSMKNDSLSKIITIGTKRDDIAIAANIASNYKDVYCCIGIHPYYADSYDDEIEKTIEKLAKNPKVVGIGEFGLDYHDYPGLPPRDVQKLVMEKQIKLAYKLKLPFSLHIRDAHGDAIEVLKKCKDYLTYSGVVHCFTGSKEVASEYLKLGLYISFSGSITYKKTYEEIIKAVPVNRMLFETDSPYLSPTPLRGTINEPKNTILTLKFVADTLDIDYKYLEKIEEENVLKLFSKIK